MPRASRSSAGPPPQVSAMRWQRARRASCTAGWSSRPRPRRTAATSPHCARPARRTCARPACSRASSIGTSASRPDSSSSSVAQRVQVHGGHQLAPVAEVGVHERARHARRLRRPRRSGPCRVARAEDLDCGLDDLRPACRWVETGAPGPRTPGRARGSMRPTRRVPRPRPPSRRPAAPRRPPAGSGRRRTDRRPPRGSAAPPRRSAPRPGGSGCGTGSRSAAPPATAGRRATSRSTRPGRSGRAPGSPTAAPPCTGGRARRTAGRAVASSHSLPRYMTATRSLTFFTTARSWVMNTSVRP